MRLLFRYVLFGHRVIQRTSQSACRSAPTRRKSCRNRHRDALPLCRLARCGAVRFDRCDKSIICAHESTRAVRVVIRYYYTADSGAFGIPVGGSRSAITSSTRYIRSRNNTYAICSSSKDIFGGAIYNYAWFSVIRSPIHTRVPKAHPDVRIGKSAASRLFVKGPKISIESSLHLLFDDERATHADVASTDNFCRPDGGMERFDNRSSG